jgi:hypothetical protein
MTLNNVLPDEAMNNRMDQAGRDIVFATHGRLRSAGAVPKDSYVSDLILGELRGPNLLATTLPSSVDPVANIVALGTDLEMTGVDTGWVIALVANDHAIGNRAIEQFVGEPVHGYRPPVGSDLRVSGSTSGGNRPTVARKVNSCSQQSLSGPRAFFWSALHGVWDSKTSLVCQ